MLSVMIPIFNEIHTLPSVLVAVSKALPEVAKEIVLVDDGSRDGTREWIRANVPQGHRSASRLGLDAHEHLVWEQDPAAAPLTIRALFHERTKGKGASLRTALAAVSGQVVVIQDADLEYEPMDWSAMHDLIVRGNAQVVYGSRFQGRREGRGAFVSLSQAGANRLISILFGILYGHRFSDVEVCYKMFTREVSDTLNITCTDFGCEIQISAQIVRSGRWKVREVPVSYRGRTSKQGKKISWRDGFKALWYLLRFRVRNGAPAVSEGSQVPHREPDELASGSQDCSAAPLLQPPVSYRP